MLIELKEEVRREKKAVEKQLELLDKQHSLIMKNDAIALECVANEIKVVNKEIAESEISKRKILNGKSLREFVFSSKDIELEELFRDMKIKVELLALQNETNKILIKQQLSYTNRMLMILNPDRQAKTYNSYGKLGR